MDKPQIFNVFIFRKNDNGTLRLDVHHVAAFTSAEAEATIKECNPSQIIGQRFIYTDAYVRYYDQSRTSLYVSNYRSDDAMTSAEFSLWKHRSTHDSDADGETYPAPFREF